MKKILITGKDSYIGTSFEKWVSQWPDKYQVTTIDVRDDSWKTHDFSKYDTVLHVAAIVHVKEKNKDLYYKVNRDLALMVAQKAKLSGIKQFIFMSTMGVYGMYSGTINKDTKICPKTPYSKSKLEAENLIFGLRDNNFKVSILRPPLVYGRFCRGNYRKLSKFIRKYNVFININNKRSMIYIDNLNEYIRNLIEISSNGIFFPQNIEYINVKELSKLIAHYNSKNLFLFPSILTTPFLRLSIFKKIFGDLVYAYDMYNTTELELVYKSNVLSFEESIKTTEIICGVKK